MGSPLSGMGSFETADRFLLEALSRVGVEGEPPVKHYFVDSREKYLIFLSTKIKIDVGDLWLYLQIWGEKCWDDLWVLSVSPDLLSLKLREYYGDTRVWLYQNSVASFTNLRDIEDLLHRWDFIGPLEEIALHSLFSPRGTLNLKYGGNLRPSEPEPWT